MESPSSWVFGGQPTSTGSLPFLIAGSDERQKNFALAESLGFPPGFPVARNLTARHELAENKKAA